jgi:hypothetical protein
MPCRSNYDDSISRDDGIVDEYANTLNEINHITRVSCEAFRLLEKNKISINEMSQESINWWKKHKKLDEKRLKEEKEKICKQQEINTALKKLSKREQKLLGLL